MGFGSDFSALDDLDSNLTFLSGDAQEVHALAQAVARRLITPRGGLFYDNGYGYDIRSLISSNTDPSEAIALIEAETRKDERVSDCTATISVTGSGIAASWAIAISCTASIGGSFSFTLAVSSVSVSLLTVGP